jgi:hypothetical protein
LRTSYVDIYSRNVGFDYHFILRKLNEVFPGSKTTLKELQKLAYFMNGSGLRLPVRRRSLRVLSRDYVRVLLTWRDKNGSGFSYQRISYQARQKFPGAAEFTLRQIRSTAGQLTRKGIELPNRPGRKS